MPPDVGFLELLAFLLVKDDLCLSHIDDVILQGNYIVISKVFCAEAVDLTHQYHQGMVKSQSLLQSKEWLPSIDRFVDRSIALFIHCLAVGLCVPPSPSPLCIGEVPGEPWNIHSFDFIGPLSTGQQLLSVTNQGPRYSVVDIMPSTSASTVISRLERILPTYGFPTTILT